MSEYQEDEQATIDTPVEDAGAVDAASVPAETGEPTPVAEGSAKITVKRAGVETEEVFVFVPPAVIGRFDPGVGPVDIDLGNLPEGAYVSRKHAKVTCEDGAWKLTDLGSSNGTYVLKDDFEKVDEADLVDGTEFALGNARFIFHIQ